MAMSTTHAPTRLPSGWMRAFFAALEAVILVWALTAAAFTMAYAATASSPHLGSATWQSAVGLATATFLLGFGLPIQTDLGTVTLIPTLLAALTALLSVAGQKYLAVNGLRYAPFTALGGLFGVVVIGIFAGRGLGAFPTGLIAAAVCAIASIFAVGKAERKLASSEYRGPILTALRRGLAALPIWLRRGCGRVSSLFWSLIALAALGTIGAVIAAWPRINTLTSQLSATTLDTVSIWLAELAYLPTMLVWSLGYLIGAGYHVGPATFSPGLAPEGLLPSVPIVLAGPLTIWSTWMLAIPAVIGAGHALRYTRARSAPRLSLHLAASLVCVVVLVVVLVCAAWITGGGLTGGPLANCGVRPLDMALWAALTIALPYMLVSVMFHRDTLKWIREKFQELKARYVTARQDGEESGEQNPGSTVADPAT